MKNKIYPCLWFDNQAKTAAEFYCAAFEDSKITAHTPMVTTFELNGQKFMGLNGGPMYKPTPSVSFMVRCETEHEVDALWQNLAEGGMPLMPLAKYPWSEKYGWVQDKFGINWQLILDNTAAMVQKIIPSLLFTQSSHGRGSEAIDFYTSIFPNSLTLMKVPYEAGESAYATTDMLKYSDFKLNEQIFVIMDSGVPQPYTFSEGISFVVDCETQEEIDHFWNKLTEGGNESQCGWLKDKFGVSWQIVPTILGSLMSNPQKSSAVIQAFMKMKKFDIQTLVDAAK